MKFIPYVFVIWFSHVAINQHGLFWETGDVKHLVACVFLAVMAGVWLRVGTANE